MTSTIKPRDLVRTPSGATGHVLEINPDGSRRVVLLDGREVDLMPRFLYLVRSAPVLPWTRYRLA
jgi:hypothetical protein